MDRGEKERTGDALLGLVAQLDRDLHPGRAARPITFDSSLDRDLGLDSLARMELLHRIEEGFGVMLPEQLFATAETPGDLLRAIRQAAPAGPPTAPARILRPEAEAGVPHRAETLLDVLDWHVQRHPDRPHIYLQG